MDGIQTKCGPGVISKEDSMEKGTGKPFMPDLRCSMLKFPHSPGMRVGIVPNPEKVHSKVLQYM
jgi:hypothetical protein